MKRREVVMSFIQSIGFIHGNNMKQIETMIFRNVSRCLHISFVIYLFCVFLDVTTNKHMFDILAPHAIYESQLSQLQLPIKSCGAGGGDAPNIGPNIWPNIFHGTYTTHTRGWIVVFASSNHANHPQI